MIDKSFLKIIDKYVSADQLRYRVIIEGTNIVFNVAAGSDEEAVEKAAELALRIGLTNEKIEELKRYIREKQKTTS